MNIGDQIVYIPQHADGDINHPDCEFGFVTSYSLSKDIAWCRFWSKQNPDELRTKANSESVRVTDLKWINSVSQEKIDKQLKDLMLDSRSFW